MFIFVNNVKTPFHFMFCLPKKYSFPPFTTQTYNVLYTIMTFVLLIRYGCQEAEQFLVNGNYTDPNAVNKDGDTALHLAAR